MRWHAPIFLLLLAVLVCSCSRKKRPPLTNPELVTPVLAARALETKSLYYNAAALPWLLQERPELVAPEDQVAESGRRRIFAQATQDPQLFRKLDREFRFDTLWLVGDPSQLKPLLEHLIETKDFTLTRLDHTSFTWKRGAASAWDAAELETLRSRFSSPAEQAHFLAHAATKLLAVRKNDEARSCLEQAEKLDAEAPEVWSGWATYRLIRGEWRDALKAADQALTLESEYLPAIACKTQALYSSKQFDAAYELSKKLIAQSPDDPGLLFYHAKLAHEAKAFHAEIKALRHLIALAERAGANVSGYRVYLGQAHAAAGDAEDAIDQLTLALLDKDLPREQRQFADELFNQIKDKTLPPIPAE